MSTLDDMAEAALRNSYAPYSRFHVGAALRSASGRHYSGCNVECASYPLGGCAERAAIAAAVLAEGPGLRISEVRVIARSEDGALQSAAPCGACRQLIIEFGRTAMVSFNGADLQTETWNATDLLPLAFVFDSKAGVPAAE